MTRGQCASSTVALTDDDEAAHMADALTYLSRVAIDAGYVTVAVDIMAVRDKLNSIALAEKVARQRGKDA